jgi:6-phosphogluconolactonase (cycloisomerase 2 family)
VATDSGELVDTLTLGAEPVAVLMHPSGRALYVSVYQSGEVIRLPVDEAGHVEAGAATRRRTSDRRCTRRVF